MFFVGPGPTDPLYVVVVVYKFPTNGVFGWPVYNIDT